MSEKHKKISKPIMSLLMAINIILITVIIPVNANEINAWSVGAVYEINDIVSYNGKNYQCIQSHTAVAGWEPVRTPALWILYTVPVLVSDKQVVLVHGGWHGQWSWYKTVDTLEKKGYTVHLVELPAHGTDETSVVNVTLDSYINKITSVLDEIDGNAILVGHGSSAGLISRAADLKPTKISKILYISGVLVQDGENIASVLLQDTGSNAMAGANIDLINGIITISPDIVYNTVSRGEFMIGASLLGFEPVAPLFESIFLSNSFYQIPKYYIKSDQDLCLSPSYQDQLLEKIACNEVFVVNSGHVPFISNDIEISNIIDEILYKNESGILSDVQAKVLSDSVLSETESTTVDFDESVIHRSTVEAYRNVRTVTFEQYYEMYNNKLVDLGEY